MLMMHEIVWIRINYNCYQKLSNVAPASKRYAYFKYFFLKSVSCVINQPVSFSLDASLLMEKIRSTEVDETSTDRILQETGDNLQSSQPL